MSARFPLEPLAALCGGMAAMERMGFDSGELHRARHNGIGIVAADRWAVRAGYHPSLVWPDWYDGALVPCAREDCDGRFVPLVHNQRYCTPRCQDVTRQRARRRRPGERVKRRAAAAAHYAECGAYVRANARRRYAESKKVSG